MSGRKEFGFAFEDPIEDRVDLVALDKFLTGADLNYAAGHVTIFSSLTNSRDHFGAPVQEHSRHIRRLEHLKLAEIPEGQRLGVCECRP